MRTLRAAYVCADPGVPVFGRKGCSIHVQEIIRALRLQGVELEVFAARLDGPVPGDLLDLTVHRLPCPGAADLAAREVESQKANDQLASLLSEHGAFDFVYERYSLWSFAGMDYADSARVPGLLEVNAPLPREQSLHRGLIDSSAAWRTAKRTFLDASSILAVSEEVAAFVRETAPVAEKIKVLTNGVDPGRFHPGVRPAWKWPDQPDAFTVGFVGTLKPWHGLSVLVEAFALLHEKAPEARLLVVGDGPERKAVEAELSRRGLMEAARFTGAVAADNIPGLLASMDVAVAPYPSLDDFYFSPLKVYEYMAASLPVVASRVGQISSLILSGHNGLLCEPGDPRALLLSIDELRGSSDLRLRLGAAARDTVLRDHTWEQVAARIVAVASEGRPGEFSHRNANEQGGAMVVEASTGHSDGASA